MKVVSLSQKGSRSPTNEDSFLVLDSKNVFVVADGVGGGPAGKVASKLLVDTLFEQLPSAPMTKHRILQSLDKANDRIRMKAEEIAQIGMSSTLVLAWVQPRSALVVHVGDSRVYRYCKAGIFRLTEDHSKQVSDESRGVRNLVTKTVGSKKDLIPSAEEHGLEAGDLLLLCSDGISDPLTDHEIEQVLSSENQSLFEKVRTLVSEAEKKGGQDDKTVILVSVE